MIPIRIQDAGPVRAPVTKALIAANVLVFALELSLGPALDAVVWRWGVVPARLVAYWRVAPFRFWEWGPPLVTAMFLHGGWTHILGNMWFLWVFGRCLENRVGSPAMLGLYFAGGILASLFHVFMRPVDAVPMIGASGAVSAVLGAFFVLGPLRPVLVMVPLFFIPLLFEVPAFLVLVLWFFEQLVSGTLSLTAAAGQAAGVAWWAHVGGFVAGTLLVRLLGESQWSEPAEEDWEEVEAPSGPWGLERPWVWLPGRQAPGALPEPPQGHQVVTVYDRWGRPVARYVVPLEEEAPRPGGRGHGGGR